MREKVPLWSFRRCLSDIQDPLVFLINQTHNNKQKGHFHKKAFRQTMTVLSKNAASPIVFKYLNLLPVGGRGGVTRFFLLSQGIDFEEDLCAMADWPAEKKRLVTTGENPSGSLPVVYMNNANGAAVAHPQHIAVSRYLARVHKVTSGDDYKDYVQDLVADEYHGFRDHWAKVTFSGTDDDKADYKENALVQYLTKFNALYQTFQTDEVFLSRSAKTGQPLWGDAAVYGLLRDHVMTKYMTTDDLAAGYPRLAAMYGAYEKIPAVQAWLENLN